MLVLLALPVCLPVLFIAGAGPQSRSISIMGYTWASVHPGAAGQWQCCVCVADLFPTDSSWQLAFVWLFTKICFREDNIHAAHSHTSTDLTTDATDWTHFLIIYFNLKINLLYCLVYTCVSHFCHSP